MARMTMATETENNGPESKEIKDVKEIKEALKDDAPPDNKQEEKDAAKKDEAAGKKDDDAAAAAAAGGTNAAPAKANIVHHPDYEKDVVYLYQFPRTPLLPSLSPYGLKVETWLRLNGIKYEVSVSPRASRCVFSRLFLRRSHDENARHRAPSPPLTLPPTSGTCVSVGL